MPLTLTIQPTDQTIETSAGEARVWAGTDEKGSAIQVLVWRVAVPNGLPEDAYAEYEALQRAGPIHGWPFHAKPTTNKDNPQ